MFRKSNTQFLIQEETAKQKRDSTTDIKPFCKKTNTENQ